MYGECNMETYITICKMESQWEFAVWFRELKLGLCSNLEGWDGEGGGREVQEGGSEVKLVSCVRLFATPWTVAHQTPSIRGIFQARILERVATSFSKREGTWVNLRLIHADVWQKPMQNCKAVIFQFKINKLKKFKNQTRKHMKLQPYQLGC